MKKRVFRIISFGGIGDVLLSTPVFGAIKQKYPQSKTIVYCMKTKSRDVYANNPYIDALRSTSFIRNPLAYLQYRFRRVPFHILNYPNYMPGITYEKHASHIIADMVGVELGNTQLQVYLTGEEEKWGREKVAAFANPIVIHITSSCSANQNWPLSYWEELVRSLPQYTFIQIGLSNEEKVPGAVDLRGTTSFRQALSILKSSISFVGVVSSFAHATNAVGVPGVVLYGPSTPKVWGHENNINLYKGLRCAPCVDLLLGSPCPYSKPCMTTISVEEVRNALLSQLSKRNIRGLVDSK